MSPLVHLLVMLTTPLAPLALALVVLLRPESRWPRAAAVLAPVPALVTGLFMPTGIGATLPWLLEGSEFGLDDVGRLFLLGSGAIWLVSAAFALRGPPDERRGRFFAFFLLAMAGNLGLIVAFDMLAFYLFFSLMSFSAYGLVVHDGTQAARRAGLVYVVLVVAGDMMLYAALVPAALDAGGAVLFAEVRESIAVSPHRDMVIALTVAGFGVKSGALGLHVALPLIYRSAPIPAAAAFAGAMLHAGLLGWLRLLPLGSELPRWGGVLIGLGIAGVIYGAVVGVLQRDVRSVLAYSSISQMGIMLAGVGAALKAPGSATVIAVALAIYALHHAFAKGALLLGVGVAARGSRERIRRAAIRAGLLLPALALPGLPLTSGMPAKEQLKEAIVGVGAPWADALADLLPWTAVATTLIVARFLWIVWPVPRGAAGSVSERFRGTASRPSPGGGISALAVGAWVAALAGTALAVWVQPIPLEPGLWRAGVLWELTWPAALGALIAAVVARALAGRRVPWIPASDFAVPLGRWLQHAVGAWRSFASGPLPAARNRVRDESTAAFRDRRWGVSASAIERVLGDFGIAVVVLIVVTLLLVLLSPAGA